MIERRAVTKALKAALATYTGRPVEIMVGPVEVVGSLTELLPYCLLEPLSGPGFEQTLMNSWSDVTFLYQVTSIGQNYEQCEALADRVRLAVIVAADRPITIPGYSLMARDPDAGPNQPDRLAELWTVTEGFQIRVTTA